MITKVYKKAALPYLLGGRVGRVVIHNHHPLISYVYHGDSPVENGSDVEFEGETASIIASQSK